MFGDGFKITTEVDKPRVVYVLFSTHLTTQLILAFHWTS